MWPELRQRDGVQVVADTDDRSEQRAVYLWLSLFRCNGCQGEGFQVPAILTFLLRSVLNELDEAINKPAGLHIALERTRGT